MRGMLNVILAVILVMAIPAAAAAGPDVRIYTAGGRELERGQLAEVLDPYEVIIFGEYHDNDVLHQLEYGLLQNVFARDNKLAVSLEMFERDVQGQLDSYLAGRLTEVEFLDKSRPWKNYRQAYRPLVEFAKAQALPVLAANIPRQAAAHYAQTGSLAGVGAELAVYLPQLHSAPDGEYRRRFMALMGSGQMPVRAEDLDRYYKAQCLKDDTMAESIADFLRQRPDYKLIHYQGDFHSRQRLGVVEKLQMLRPELKVAVITPVYTENPADLANLPPRYRNAGDIIIFLQQPGQQGEK